MEIIASDTDTALARMLDSYEHPAILVTPDYRILATNDQYREKFGAIDGSAGPAHCYRVSHDYDRPCDQADQPAAAKFLVNFAPPAVEVHDLGHPFIGHVFDDIGQEGQARVIRDD